MHNVPATSYGILEQNCSDTALAEAAEHIQNLGFAVVDSGYSLSETQHIAKAFDQAKASYLRLYGEASLKAINEQHTLRALLTHGGDVFIGLALNDKVLSLVTHLLTGKFILNQQNGIINPAQETYNQGAWHRDLPYQHFVSSKPLAINALFCIDDFTADNGATYVLPASHKMAALPSERYIQKNAVQIKATAGQFIVLDAMLFHAGGRNQTHADRRAVNHIYNIPYFKQQISLPLNIDKAYLSASAIDILGFGFTEAASIAQFLVTRAAKL